mgnify:CR=1 FL=1
MKRKISSNKILLIISSAVNIFLLLILYITIKGGIGNLCFDKNKATLIMVHKTDCYIMDYIKDNMSGRNTLPSREYLYNYIRESPFLNDLSVEIIYSPQDLISFRGNKYNLLIFDKKTGIGKWSKIKIK